MAHVSALSDIPQSPHDLTVGDKRLATMLHRAWVTRWRAPLKSNGYAKRAYEIAHRSSSENTDTFIGEAARILGWHARWKGEFETALGFFLEAEELLGASDSNHARVEAMAGRSVVLYSQGKQDEASELIREALTLLGRDGAAATRVDLFMVQATIISYSGAFEEALTLSEDAIELARQAGAWSEMAQAVHVKGRIMMRQGNFPEAMTVAVEGMALAEQSRNTVVMPYACEVLGLAYLAAGNFDDAKTFARKALSLGEARDDKRVLCQSLSLLGKVERSGENPTRALDYQRKGLAIAKEIDYPLWQRVFQLEIADILEADGQFREALEAYKAFGKLDQDLFRRETETRMAEMHTKFDLMRARELAEAEHARAEELAQAQRIAELAVRTDGLTKIANREGLDQYIEANGILKSETTFTYVVVDLDRFKPINDTFGHAAGDAVLIETAARLKSVLRREDLVARIGGDEFALFVMPASNLESTQQLGERLVAVFSAPVLFEGRHLDISASIGIATSDIATRDLDKLMSSADQAMYAAKADRHTSYRIFDRQKFGETVNLNTMETIRQAISGGQFQPFYQPKMDIRTGQVVGFEALARWIKPDGNVSYPAEFLPLIEQHNLQTEFTFAILNQALEQLTAWQSLNGPPPRIAVNMVEELLASPNACDDIMALVKRYSSIASLITFEITEDIFLDRGLEAIQASMQRLSESGIRFSMDDFGTGYGSFLHLRTLALHELKIDIEFVQGIGKDRSAEVIIEGFIAIARGLGLDVTAEGVETEIQADFLVQRGCHIGQGFLYSAALPRDSATKLLSASEVRISA